MVPPGGVFKGRGVFLNNPKDSVWEDWGTLQNIREDPPKKESYEFFIFRIFIPFWMPSDGWGPVPGAEVPFFSVSPP